MFPVLAALGCIVFVCLHLFEIWPLPISGRVMIQVVSTGFVVVELSFYLYFRNHTRMLQWYSDIPETTLKSRSSLFSRMLHSLDGDEWKDRKNAAKFLQGWFFGVSVNLIRRGNFSQWLCWALFYKFPTELTDHEVCELEGYVDLFESETKIKFKRGFNPDVKSIRLSLDPLWAHHRFLVIYLVVGIFNSFSRVVLMLLGFERRPLGGFNYWYHPGNLETNQCKSKRRRRVDENGNIVTEEKCGHKGDGDDDEEESEGGHSYPLVFIHGLGHGLLWYLPFLRGVRERPLFLIELPHISTRIWEHIPSPSATVDTIQTILQEHNYRQAIFCGHSYGTFTVSWCLKFCPEMIKAVILIDPVCLLLCLPKVAYSFCYKTPHNILSSLQFFFLSRELGIARTMNRHFWWQWNALFLEDLLHTEQLTVHAAKDFSEFRKSMRFRHSHASPADLSGGLSTRLLPTSTSEEVSNIMAMSSVDEDKVDEDENEDDEEEECGNSVGATRKFRSLLSSPELGSMHDSPKLNAPKHNNRGEQNSHTSKHQSNPLLPRGSTGAGEAAICLPSLTLEDCRAKYFNATGSNMCEHNHPLLHFYGCHHAAGDSEEEEEDIVVGPGGSIQVKKKEKLVPTTTVSSPPGSPIPCSPTSDGGLRKRFRSISTHVRVPSYHRTSDGDKKTEGGSETPKPSAGPVKLNSSFKVSIIISGQDSLVPSEEIMNHLRLYNILPRNLPKEEREKLKLPKHVSSQEGGERTNAYGKFVRLLHYPKMEHGGFLFNKQCQEDISKTLSWLDSEHME